MEAALSESDVDYILSVLERLRMDAVRGREGVPQGSKLAHMYDGKVYAYGVATSTIYAKLTEREDEGW